MTKKHKNTLFQSSMSIMLVVGTGVVMLSPQVSVIRKVSEYSVHIMLLLLGLSMLAMIFQKQKIMFAGLACSTALCVFLKEASNDTMKLPQANTEAKIRIAHVNLSNITFDFEVIEQELSRENVDLVSFQELTPDWGMILKEQFIERYPYALSEVRIDPYGMAIYSKTPFVATDIFQCTGKPNLCITVEKDKEKFEIISSYLTPALDQKSIETATMQLDAITNKIKTTITPVVALGEYNMVYWTNEIRAFRTECKLTNSRRGLSQGNLRVPYDHIFFSQGLECTSFKEMKDSTQNYIGIVGTYQIKKENEHPTLNSQLSMDLDKK